MRIHGLPPLVIFTDCKLLWRARARALPACRGLKQSKKYWARGRTVILLHYAHFKWQHLDHLNDGGVAAR